MMEAQQVAIMDKPDAKPASVKLLSASGATMMEVESIGGEGGRLKMQGKMMGEFPQAIFLGPDQLMPLLRMGFRPGVLFFFWLGMWRLIVSEVASGRFLQSGLRELGFVAFIAGFTVATPLMLAVAAVAAALAPAMVLALTLASLVAALAGTRFKGRRKDGEKPQT